MNRYSRLLVVIFILLSGMVLLPQQNLVAGVVSWHRFAQVYEDTVTITLAQYFADTGSLEVHATSTSNGAATLMVYRASDNTLIGTLTSNNTDYRGVFTTSPNPESIIVRSSVSGEATAPVTLGTGAPQTLPQTGVAPPTPDIASFWLVGGLAALGIAVLALMRRRSR